VAFFFSKKKNASEKEKVKKFSLRGFFLSKPFAFYHCFKTN
jgi:hypothetical protein